ncbi:unnamed protein product [Adineta steineri]|uniref:Uncharacterized protein n=1 Tax=Adineta steineri TaxID=433720 RepID=A0A818Z4T0_9BILA|nr:unnamed protein product [Adineta steineri]CAF3759062.1 unnamed protein product [Adineta steineri]
MDWTAAKSYYIGYNSLTRILSITFIHNYLLTWSIALICSLILPLLYIFSPGSLRTTRTTHFLLICIVCLSYMSPLYIQVYMTSSGGEPNLSYHSCRFIVYISTFAKPIGIYLTLLFSTERLFTKIFSKIFLRLNNHQKLFQKLYTIIIFLCLLIIFSIRLDQVLKLLPRNQSIINQTSDAEMDTYVDISDTSNNSTDRNISFKYCFMSMNIDTYKKILSFYVIQSYSEHFMLSIIILILFTITFQQYCLLRNQQQGLTRRFSINTKFYISLSSCVIASELMLLFFHLIVDDINNNNTDVQLISLQFMLFAFNFRCIVLPLVICMTTCDPLKQLLHELFIVRPYLNNIDENDNTETMNDRPEPFSSSQRTSNRIEQRFRRAFKRNYPNNDELQDDL